MGRLTKVREDNKGPIEILCKEIGYPFDGRLERPEILVAFVGVLVSHIADMRGLRSVLAEKIKTPSPSDESGEVLRRVEEMLASNDVDGLIPKAADVHDFIHSVEGHEDGPCDHLIDMLSSCVSAIRFGLEKPCRSRHAAEAANHVWGRLYGVQMFDEHTARWEDDWARIQFQTALAARVGTTALTEAPHD